VISPSGELQAELHGLPLQGEENTLEVCRHLVQEWTRRGQRLHPPRLAPPHDDSDCLCSQLDDPSNQLRIQVIKALIDPKVWGSLAREGKISTEIKSPADAAELLRMAIDKKAERTPLAQRSELLLALDAMGSASVALGVVVEEFRQRHGAWCKSLGFRSVGLAGRSSHMIYRLDSREAEDAA
jgi:hypothetical protein